MLERVVGWIKALCAYIAGESAGKAAVQDNEDKETLDVATDVAHADGNSPDDRAGTVGSLLNGSF